MEERMEERTFFRLGAVFALLGVALGAFGAHGLRGSVSPEDLATFETGVRYQVYHALGLLIVAQAVILVFSGSLYALVLTGQRWMGAVTPAGGLCFLVGWGLLAWAAGKR
jgi:uncharacterized membrane protein YgdD (TMEM256/DUF423 family)